MSGRVKVGAWLPFTGVEECDGRSFAWQARVGRGLLVVTDRFDRGAGSMEGRLFGRIRLYRSADTNTTRSAAGRAALEAIWTPASLLPQRGVAWHAESDEVIVAAWDVPPERPEVRLRIDRRGAVQSAWAQRWRGDSGYVACGCDVHAERRWGDLVVPSRLSGGMVDESTFVAQGGELAGGASETVSAELEPGKYELLCFMAGHYAAGQKMAFEVK